jgi:spore maturation protein CgeB
MNFAIFGHSIRSDWNHGNAHFLRGLMRALEELGHHASFYEAVNNWSVDNLRQEHGEAPLLDFASHFPNLRYNLYNPALLSNPQRLRSWLLRTLASVDVALVHEWNDPALVVELGRMRRAGEFGPHLHALFHDTHYRAYSEPEKMRALQLENYDAVLSFSPAITEIYRRDFGLPHVYTVHEAADPDLFRPLALPKEQDIVFIGNWGDNDRNETLEIYLLQPSNLLPDLRFAIYGVRYGAALLERFARDYHVQYRGWVANYRAPLVYAASKMSVHLPRQQYTSVVYGTPTIRVFETLACGLPLISLPWPDTDGLFCAGEDYLVVEDQAEMVAAMRQLAADPAARKKLGDSGRARILAHHTVRHRARQILGIVEGLALARA